MTSFRYVRSTIFVRSNRLANQIVGLLISIGVNIWQLLSWQPEVVQGRTIAYSNRLIALSRMVVVSSNLDHWFKRYVRFCDILQVNNILRGFVFWNYLLLVISIIPTEDRWRPTMVLVEVLEVSVLVLFAVKTW